MRKILALCLAIVLIVSLSTSVCFGSGIDQKNVNVYYINGDWRYVPVQLSVPDKEKNIALYALRFLVENTKLPTGCYREIPEGMNIKALDIRGNTAYIDIDASVLNKIDNKNYSLDVIKDILSYNVFQLVSVDEVKYTFDGQANGKMQGVAKSTFFGLSPEKVPSKEVVDKIKGIKDKLKDMSKKEIEQFLIAEKQRKINTSTNSISSLQSYDPSVSIIVIDPGHGGSDSGAVGYLDGYQKTEKFNNLYISLWLKSYLEEHGYTIYMTRNSDVDVTITNRYTLANNVNADLFISVHINSNPSSTPRGTTGIYPNNHDITESQDAIQWMHHFVKTFNLPENQAPYQDVRDLGVLRGTTMPAVLTETGFMSNQTDLTYLDSLSNLQSIAESIHLGVQYWDVYGDF